MVVVWWWVVVGGGRWWQWYKVQLSFLPQSDGRHPHMYVLEPDVSVGNGAPGVPSLFGVVTAMFLGNVIGKMGL